MCGLRSRSGSDAVIRQSGAGAGMGQGLRLKKFWKNRDTANVSTAGMNIRASALLAS